LASGEKNFIADFKRYFTRRLLTVFALGFSSGLPLALTASTLTTWLGEAKVDMTAIGLFAAAGTPYTLKFLWSPLMDTLSFPVLTRVLGRRRGWMLATQLALVASLLFMAVTSPDVNAWMTAAAAFAIAFFSASQDIVIDAYRIDILPTEEQGDGAAMSLLGYRIGMLASGGGALFLATRLGWHGTYVAMAALMGIGIITTLVAKEPKSPKDGPRQSRNFAKWFRESVIAPLKDFATHPTWWQILIFIVIYRLADAFIGNMTRPFLREIGFTKDTIGLYVSTWGMAPTIIGAFAGGMLSLRFGTLRVLFLGGVLHAVTNLCYVWQVYAGNNDAVLIISTTVENFTGGIATAAFVAYTSNLCNVHYTATQYALLSALSSLGRTWLSTPAGYVAKHLGWSWFFGLSALLALPGLILILTLHRKLEAGNRKR
jgi:MFS transporter, PAT family, beta-lactamase induction signal transducer AmpG